MSEEVHNAAVVIPWAIIFSIVLNGALGFGMLLAALFRLGDPVIVLSTSSPFMTIFQQAMGPNGANAMIAIIILLALWRLYPFRPELPVWLDLLLVIEAYLAGNP